MPAPYHRARSFWHDWALPTWLVIAGVYGGFLLLTWTYHALPPWLAAPLLAFVLAWHGSLQHETIHAHPTRSRRINAALGWPPLALWLPYAVYHETHLRHHGAGDRGLTVPALDPESHYLDPAAFSGFGFVRQAAFRVNRTLAGRLVIGPAIAITRLWSHELRRQAAHSRSGIRLAHAVGVAIVLGWVVGVCQIPLSLYLLAVVYPSVSLSLLRSFVEHRAAPEPSHRTAIVETHPFWALLFLNNQLHQMHHARPDLPWYDLPLAWHEAALAADLGDGMHFPGGYSEVACRYLFRPFIAAEHPFGKVL